MEENQETKLSYEALWKAIIRPPRDLYLDVDLGDIEFSINNILYIRKDFEIVDFQGLMLKVSFIEPDAKYRPYDIMPCVIYVHANSSSRVEGINMKKYLLKNNINVCCFDFEGSGYSEGEYISLGFYEKNQLKNVVDFVEKYPGVGSIGLWGRSMGASTTLIYASSDPRIKCIVVDSPFTDFRRVAKEMCSARISIPGFLIEGAISIIGKTVNKKNGMNVNGVKPIEAVVNCKIPVIFIHARDDEMVKYQHTLDLFEKYAGEDKKLIDVTGGHNGRRKIQVLETVGSFFKKHLSNGEDDLIQLIQDNIFVPDKDNKNFLETMTFNFTNRTKKTIYEEFGLPNKDDDHKNIINNNKNEIIEKNEKEKKELKKEEEKKEIKKEENKKEEEKKEIIKKVEEKKEMVKKEDNKIKKEEKKEEPKIVKKEDKKENIIIKKERDSIYKDNFIINKNKNLFQDNIINIKADNNDIINDTNNQDNEIFLKSLTVMEKGSNKKKTIYDALNIRK